MNKPVRVWMVFGSWIVILGIGVLWGYNSGEADQKNQDATLFQAVATPAPTLPPLSTPSPTIVPVVKYVAPPPTFDPDPTVACTIPMNCGGGIEKIGTRECSQLTCCQVGDNWTLYTTQAQCSDAQNKSSSSLVSVQCTTKYGTVPVYGDNYGDALAQCETFQSEIQ